MEKSRMVSAVGALTLLAGATVPAWSADGGTPVSEQDQKDKEKEEKLIEKLSALTTTSEGLRDKPSDTVATGGGKLEGYILSSIAIEGAARNIAGAVLTAGDPVLVMATDDAYSADSWYIFDATLKGQCTQLVGNPDCKKPGTSGGRPARPGDDAPGGAGVVALAGAVLPFLSSLLRSETEISSLGEGLKDSRLLAKAIVGICHYGGVQFKGAADKTPCVGGVSLFQPPRLRGSIETSKPWNRLTELMARRNELDTPKATAATKAKIKTADAFIVASLTADDKGKVPLLEAIRGEQLNALIGDKRILTVAIEEADGTILKRKGIDVALGAPSVRASGGVIVSYTLESKESGTWSVTTSNQFPCATRLTELKKVHRLADTDVALCRQPR